MYYTNSIQESCFHLSYIGISHYFSTKTGRHDDLFGSNDITQLDHLDRTCHVQQKSIFVVLCLTYVRKEFYLLRQ